MFKYFKILLAYSPMRMSKVVFDKPHFCSQAGWGRGQWLCLHCIMLLRVWTLLFIQQFSIFSIFNHFVRTEGVTFKSRIIITIKLYNNLYIENAIFKNPFCHKFQASNVFHRGLHNGKQQVEITSILFAGSPKFVVVTLLNWDSTLCLIN